MKIKLVSTGKGIHSPEFYKKKKKIKRIKRILLTIVSVLFAALLVFLVRYERFLISEVRVSGEGISDTQEIISEVERRLADNYLWIIPKSNALFYPRRTIRAALYDEFPRFQSVNLSLSGLNTLVVEVEEREPFALYCKTSDDCYFMDEDGLIFAEAPSFSAGVYIPHSLENPPESPIGEIFLPKDDFDKLLWFVDSLASLGINPVSVQAGEREYQLTLPAGGAILWQRGSDPSLIRANLEAFLSSEPIRSQGNFLYRVDSLDLRTENKVFYKFKEQ